MLPVGTHYVACKALLDARASILWKSVDEGWVRFDPYAGQTLLLAPIARFVLDMLSLDEESRDEEGLMEAIRQEEPDADPVECRIQVQAAIKALLDAGLIQALPR